MIPNQWQGRDFLAASLEASLSISPDEDMARQDQARDADVNFIVGRHGLGGPDPRDWLTGEQDFTMDLTAMMGVVRSAQDAYSALPEKVRGAHGGFVEYINAAMKAEIGRQRAGEPLAGSQAEGEPVQPKPLTPAPEAGKTAIPADSGGSAA